MSGGTGSVFPNLGDIEEEEEEEESIGGGASV